jgi:hypothetical protein
MPVASPSGAPTPDPAPEGGEVLAAGRARGLAAKNRNQPQALELTSVSDAVKGPLRRALPALDSAINARNAAGHGGYVCAAAEVGRGPFHTKRHRPAEDAQNELNALILFKSDLGAFIRLYTFLSQIFNYGNTAIEKRAIFYKRLLPLLEFGREREGRGQLTKRKKSYASQGIARPSSESPADVMRDRLAAGPISDPLGCATAAARRWWFP